MSHSEVAAQSVYNRFLATRFSFTTANQLDVLCALPPVAQQRPDKIATTVDDVTLVTHLSMDRLPLLVQVVTAWEGPVSATVFVEDGQLYALHRAVETQGLLLAAGGPVALHVVFGGGGGGAHYPVNVARNVALAQVRTTHVLMVDVDLVPSAGLHRALQAILRGSREHGGRSIVGPRDALIVPAFETDSYSARAPRDRAQLKEQYAHGLVRAFRSREWPDGHRLVDYKRFFQEGDKHSGGATSGMPCYDTLWNEGSEPYVVMRVDGSPWYEGRMVCMSPRTPLVIHFICMYACT